MLELVKLALRRTESEFEPEIEMHISDCLAELSALGVLPAEDAEEDSQIQACVVYYCKWKFGNNSDAERWEHIYRDKVTKLMYMTGYGLKEE